MPTALSDADAAKLVGMCAACRRLDGDPLRVLQLGVSDALLYLCESRIFCYCHRGETNDYG